jgi:hypothetical protein
VAPKVPPHSYPGPIQPHDREEPIDLLRVLVVDDDPDARVALARAVRSLGFACEVALNGQDAWEIQSPSAAGPAKPKEAGRNRVVAE